MDTPGNLIRDPETGEPSLHIITCQDTNDNVYVLTAVPPANGNPDGSAIVTTNYDGYYDNWYIGIVGNNFYIQSLACTGMYLISDQDSSPVILRSTTGSNSDWLWESDNNNFGNPNPIVLVRNTNMNLNVEAGDNDPAEGSPVCVWVWGGGNPNEMWQIRPNGSSQVSKAVNSAVS